MDTDEIVPSILPAVPSSKLTVTYPNDKFIDFGTEITPLETKDLPLVSWEAAPDKFYTLLMIDPDAPSRRYPVVAEVCHWLVGNVKGSDVSTGEVICEYRGSGAPRGTGFHRYVFVVFEHVDRVNFGSPITSRMGRIRFSTKKFMEKHKFEIFAWNYLKAQWTADPNQRSWMCVVT